MQLRLRKLLKVKQLKRIKGTALWQYLSVLNHPILGMTLTEQDCLPTECLMHYQIDLIGVAKKLVKHCKTVNKQVCMQTPCLFLVS